VPLPQRQSLHALILGLSVLAAGVAQASPVLCPPTCPSGPPHGEATFFGASTKDFFELQAPYSIDLSYSDSQGAGRAAADPTSGVLKASSTASAGAPQFTAMATVSDVFTLQGSYSGPVPVTAILSGSGTGLIPIAGESLTALVSFQGPALPISPFDKRVFQAGTNAPLDTSFPISLSASGSFTEAIGVPFQLDYSLRLDTRDTTSLDFLSTANLGFNLPTGVTISSLGGFTPVPEPATFWLTAYGLVVMTAVSSRRRSQ